MTAPIVTVCAGVEPQQPVGQLPALLTPLLSPQAFHTMDTAAGRGVGK